MTLYATLLLCAMLNNPYYANYVSPSDDYTIEVPASIEVKRVDQQKGYLDIFHYADTLDGKSGPGFMLTVLRTTPRNDFKFSSLTSKEFQRGYEDGCKCQVTGYDEVQYKKEKGVSYTTSYKRGKVAMAGYTVTFQKGSHLYLINFSTTEASKDKYFNDYFHAMNTFDLHPAKMIVGGYRNSTLGGR